jgi:hypothetical protein
MIGLGQKDKIIKDHNFVWKNDKNYPAHLIYYSGNFISLV